MPNLRMIARSFVKESDALLAFISEAHSASSKTQQIRLTTEYVVIKLHDSWAFRTRQLVLNSSLGGYSTTRGKRLRRAKNLPRYQSPMTKIRASWTPKRNMKKSWEPKWYDSDEALRAGRILGIQNYVEVATGLGSGTSVNELRIVRNVIAHNLPNTWDKFRQLSASKLPHEFVLQLSGASGKSIILGWVLELRASLIAAAA